MSTEMGSLVYNYNYNFKIEFSNCKHFLKTFDTDWLAGAVAQWSSG